MSFVIDARTILELGRELISSDEVAIYELIKNSLDADADNINFEITSHFKFLTTKKLSKKLSTKNSIKRRLQISCVQN